MKMNQKETYKEGFIDGVIAVFLLAYVAGIIWYYCR